jgi:hypothetical protein
VTRATILFAFSYIRIPQTAEARINQMVELQNTAGVQSQPGPRKAAVKTLYTVIPLAKNRVFCGWARADLNREDFALLVLWVQTTVAHALLVTFVPRRHGPGRI